MADKAQCITQIRFALEQLSESNGQHDWEHLCRHLARERICSNILPATGPVQAGGDQGRDFETFRTYLAGTRLTGRSFVGLVSDKPLAFACTLEKRVEAKIRGDVATIMSSGTPIEGIFVFCTQDVPVARRHRLQEAARTRYAVRLEILDGAAISEQLADRDLFWLAERYLHLPAELLPASLEAKDEQDWYDRTLDKWRRETRPAQTFADFTEIRAAARNALGPFEYDDQGGFAFRYDRSELPFWIERLDEIAECDTLPMLRRRASYEASVLRLRGLGSLVGQEERLRLYFAQIPRLDDSSDLEDASNLLTYAMAARDMGLAALEESELRSWHQAEEERLDELLAKAEVDGKVNERCALLETRGYVSFFHLLQIGEANTTQGFQYWKQLAELATMAPLFPIERFADRLAQHARFIGSHADYGLLAEAVDTIVARRFGQFKAAEKCLERAKAFRAAGDLPRAMAQLHRAKIDWFAVETLPKALQAIEWLSMAYAEQGLYFAAKYYALAAAYTVLYARDLQLKPGLARSLQHAASFDYALGAWHGFLELAEASAIFYPHFAVDRTADFNNPDSALHHLIFYLSLLPAATRLLHPELEGFVQDRLVCIGEKMGFAGVLTEVRGEVDGFWESKGREELWETIEEQLAGTPWSDAGMERHTQWQAHGVTWRVHWSNDYETTLAAEGFLAGLQIFLSELAGKDLCLPRSTVNIGIRLDPEFRNNRFTSDGDGGYKGFDVDFELSHEERRATVTLPAYSAFRDDLLSGEDLQIGAVAITCSLLEHISLLSHERFSELLEALYAQGLQNKLLVGAHYGQCLNEFLGQQVFEDSARSSRNALEPPRPFVPRPNRVLPWFDGPGPGYDPEAAKAQIQNRYENFTIRIAYTLRRLVHEPSFQEVVASLRADGWKDWHILMAVYHVTVNYRINHRAPLWLSEEAEREYAERIARQHEAEDAMPVPLDEYREEKLRQMLPVYLLSFARTYGLENRQITPDFPAVEDFLRHRYNFWSDDVEHEDVLGTN